MPIVIISVEDQVLKQAASWGRQYHDKVYKLETFYFGGIKAGERITFYGLTDMSGHQILSPATLVQQLQQRNLPKEFNIILDFLGCDDAYVNQVAQQLIAAGYLKITVNAMMSSATNQRLTADANGLVLQGIPPKKKLAYEKKLASTLAAYDQSVKKCIEELAQLEIRSAQLEEKLQLMRDNKNERE